MQRTPADDNVALEGRLLTWQRDRNTYRAETAVAIGIVFPYRRGYHWEIFAAGEVQYSGQTRSLHSALCHVEGNFVGRGLLGTEEEDEPALGVSMEGAQAAAE